LEGREIEGGGDKEKRRDRGGGKGRKRDREGGGEREKIVWECWMSSLSMLSRREGGRERDKSKREEREKSRRERVRNWREKVREINRERDLKGEREGGR
jgi:hypothetical protein